MNIDKWSICSERRKRDGREHNIIYEWEDILSLELGIKIIDTNNIIITYIDKILGRIGINPFGYFQIKKTIAFKLSTNVYTDWSNSSKVIPWLIDFYLPKNEFNLFFKITNRNRIVFISSREVYDALAEHPNFNNKKYIHMPLSLPDKYRINGSERIEKKYDLVMPGRSDSLLLSFVKRYADENPDFKYVTREYVDGKCAYSVNSKLFGKIKLNSADSHDAYIDLVKSGKIGLWSTRGLDFSECNGYNQVTPRLFELMVSGCHLILRYPDNADTRYWRLNQLSTSVEDYKVFETQMDKYRNNEVNMKTYTDFLCNRYTSDLVSEIKKYLY